MPKSDLFELLFAVKLEQNSTADEMVEQCAEKWKKANWAKIEQRLAAALGQPNLDISEPFTARTAME